MEALIGLGFERALRRRPRGARRGSRRPGLPRSRAQSPTSAGNGAAGRGGGNLPGRAGGEAGPTAGASRPWPDRPPAWRPRRRRWRGSRPPAAAAPRDPGPQGEAADVLRELGRLEEAEAGYRSALDLDARNSRRFSAWAGSPASAATAPPPQRCFEQAAAIDPTAAAAQLQLAAESRDRGDFDAARRILEAVLARTPHEFNAWISLAQIERRAGRRDAALAAFGRAVELNPGYSQGLAEMAVEERALGRPFSRRTPAGPRPRSRSEERRRIAPDG